MAKYKNLDIREVEEIEIDQKTKYLYGLHRVD